MQDPFLYNVLHKITKSTIILDNEGELKEMQSYNHIFFVFVV